MQTHSGLGLLLAMSFSNYGQSWVTGANKLKWLITHEQGKVIFWHVLCFMYVFTIYFLASTTIWSHLSLCSICACADPTQQDNTHWASQLWLLQLPGIHAAKCTFSPVSALHRKHSTFVHSTESPLGISYHQIPGLLHKSFSLFMTQTHDLSLWNLTCSFCACVCRLQSMLPQQSSWRSRRSWRRKPGSWRGERGSWSHTAWDLEPVREGGDEEFIFWGGV